MALKNVVPVFQRDVSDISSVVASRVIINICKFSFEFLLLRQAVYIDAFKLLLSASWYSHRDFYMGSQMNLEIQSNIFEAQTF